MILRRSVAFVAALLLLAGAAYGRECKDDPDVAGQCFMVHGRFSGTASGNVELSPVGRDPLRGRILGVLVGPDPYPGRSEEIWMPDALKRIMADDDFYGPKPMDTFGDFEVCRLEPDVPGRMRAVCVQSADHLVIRRGR